MAIESILPSDSGKVAFEKTGRNFELLARILDELSNTRGYLSTKRLEEGLDFNNIPRLNGIYMLSTRTNAPMILDYNQWYFVEVTVHNENYLTQEAWTFVGEVCNRWTRILNNNVWQSWDGMAPMSIVNKKVNLDEYNTTKKGLTIDTWLTIDGDTGGNASFLCNLYNDNEGHYRYINDHPNGSGAGFKAGIFITDKPKWIFSTDASAKKDAIANIVEVDLAKTKKVDVALNTGWFDVGNCGSTYVIVGDILIYSTIVRGDGTNNSIVQLPPPRTASGANMWYGGSACTTSNKPSYLVVQPDGWVIFQSGYNPNEPYAISISYPI